VLDVRGMDEARIRAALRSRLQQYMYDPQVDVFTEEYRSRQVGVVGAVKQPGVYPLASHNDTVLEMISRAGGMTELAGTRVAVIPGRSAQPYDLHAVHALLASGERPRTASDPSRQQARLPSAAEAAGTQSWPAPVGVSDNHDRNGAFRTGGVEPVIIDIASLSDQAYLDLPARAGDVIVVPSAGEVMVEGWVENPGAYKITPGLTVVGAVAAAGGALFTWSATVLRTDENGVKVRLPVDLAAAKAGRAPDPAVRGGDVVVVERSAVGAAPYLAYLLFKKFNTGMHMPFPIF
jgi:protein involved in polysaccharide export with SLBB domain